MDIKKYTDDDFCDLYANRICDNCGNCLKEEGIDVKAIKIEDIAKTVEENQFLENEYKKMIEAAKEEELLVEENQGVGEYLLEDEAGDYVDAFDHIEYIDDLEMFGDDSFDEATEEIFPGVRKLKEKY